ncbi:MAG: acyltransferase [Deltaproteobacteria bacterium]|nr:acyltransferase [Deltaproteobacteria bacterium]
MAVDTAAGAIEFDAIARELALGERHQHWRGELASSEDWSEPEKTPSSDETARACEHLGVDAEAAAVAVEAAREMERSPSLQRLHRHALWLLFGSRRFPFEIVWPMLPDALGASSRMFYLLVLVSALPHVRAEHARLGIPEDISRDTLADVGRNVQRYRALHRRPGFDEMNWLSWHFLGRLFQLGRLQFLLSRFWFPLDPNASTPPPALAPWEPVLDLHVPESGPLSPEACDDSIARAGPFFARHFPEFRYRGMTILSWLLEPRLAESLDARSNIVRFQRRFTLVPLAQEMPGNVFKFVFHEPNQTPSTADLDALPQRSALERAIVAHVRVGGSWSARAGYFVCEAASAPVP